MVGDRRLLPDYCHMEDQLAHPGTMRHLHPSPAQPYHPLHLGRGLRRILGGGGVECKLKTSAIFFTNVRIRTVFDPYF